jgi:class 3 adenylate cyclase/tetratricopeptide (TPR) repeat protein
MDVADWLRALGLERYEAAFRENDVGAELLPNLTADDLRELGITSVGHRRQLLEAIAALRFKDTPVVDPRPPSVLAEKLDPLETTAERRPLSVMFCDLVGSTALSSRLDPEDLREVLRSYQACVATTIRQFDGFIARYVGDGVLIYFGWPEARETDAERAVRAALAVAAGISAIPVSGEPLQVRIGIATGLVVIGEPIGSGDSRQQTAVGETPNLAARLQSLAEPNQVVIDGATRRQIGGLFECQDLGTFDLKGLPAALPAWQVVSENRTLGQFEALRSGATPLVGRDEEMELLLRRWAQAKAGGGRVVLISAEPGVGKSRLAEALAERIAAEPHVRHRYFCSPHHQDSALYPVIAQIERAAGFAHSDEPAVRLAKLQALLAATAPPIEDVALVAELLSLPSVDLSPPLDFTPQRKKEKTFEALLRQVEGLSGQQPVLMIFDDLHWIDPSSRELLDRTVERIAGWPVLLLAMFRPEFQPPWIGQPHVTMVTLARLDRRNTAAMVANVAGNGALPPEVIEEIADRTDGVPLFVEELTKAVLESGTQAPAALSSVPHPSVPPTLHASLMARLDRLGPAAKDAAQTGAAIGREFGYALLASVTDLSEPQIREALDRLTNSGLLFVRGTPPQSSYIFKHALVQDAAYGTLLRGRRQRLHARIAVILEDRFPELVLAQPTLLAQHFVEAGLTERAVGYWLKAGQQALARSAMTEAVAQLRKGLEVLTVLPDSPERGRQELDLQTALGAALTATKGFAAAEVAETLARARALAEQFDRPEHVVPLIAHQWAFHLIRAEYRLALAQAEQVDRMGEARNDVATRLLGRYLHGHTRLFLGEFVTARALLEGCMGLADPAHRNIAGGSVDNYSGMLIYLAVTLACLGYIDQARSRRDEAMSEARRLRHAYTLADVLITASWFDWHTRSPVEHFDELQTLATENGFSFCLGWAQVWRARSLMTLGQAQKGLALLRQGVAELRASGAVMSVPLLFTWLAEAYATLGQPDEERKCLAEAARVVEITDERVDEAELLYRVPGDLLNAAGDRSAAEQRYRQAIAIAERQNAKLFQLRASTSLARLWRDQGRRGEAVDLLGPIYGWFTEGFDAPDLKDARALLDELA